MRLGGISARCRGDAGGYCAARVQQVLEVQVQKCLELRNRHDFTPGEESSEFSKQGSY